MFSSHLCRPVAYLLTAGIVVAALCIDSPQRPLSPVEGCNGLFQNTGVGGVKVDASGAIQRLDVDQLNRVAKQRADALIDADADMTKPSKLRKVSLRKLEEAIAKNLKDGNPIPEEAKLLAGLQQIQYVFVYPEQQDIVLAGFGEGWKVDQRGNLVGLTTGKPVMYLDDLLVALRHADQAAHGDISCSIDPSPEGMNRLRQHVAGLKTIGDPQQTGRGIEQALGPQMVTVHGVANTTHLAHVLVAADYRMKRIGMNLDPSPVQGLVSYLNLIGGSGRGMSAVAPRWWLVPDYQPILVDPEGLAFELRGASVKCLTEDAVVGANGKLQQQAGQTSPAAQKWADMMTTKYAALSQKEPIFAELQNVMDLAVVAALIHKENLAHKSGHSFPLLLNPQQLPTDVLPGIKHTDTVASLVQKGSNWVISASGGVQIRAGAVVEKRQTSGDVKPVRTQATAQNKSWWWD
jgi:hypothetical protein